MSIDLEWDKLDASLASSLVSALNRQLSATPRPSFIGPIEVTSLEFGTTSPDVELVDLRDIYRDFLEDDEDVDDTARDPVKESQWTDDDDDDFEWVSRKAVRGKGLEEEVPAYHLLPPHMRYGQGTAADMLSSSLHSQRDIWSPAFSSLVDLRPTYPSPSLYASAASSLSTSARPNPVQLKLSPQNTQLPLQDAEVTQESSKPTEAKPNTLNHPNLQLHLHITWNSNLRLTLTTSLLINYPSPMFMSLPIKLSVAGILFNGEVVVAYEGERRRVHVCILDDLDPYSPLAGDRPRRDTPSSGGTPPEPDEDTPVSVIGQARAGKPLPIGQRLLPSIYIESEIGQADKHVLKNVTRVERFIQDVIRKTVEEELVFPNFHTLVLGDVAQ
ncbi:uncharacterized protein FIBRA_01649 [Fibroporia radiculosa]|uniref:Mitochondrial distribution and morphology protein 12 n=1 Tax=Fibroporia radiculosa TaxID=599839 RepID=J4H1B9_9APHY|nr:uncharacterized protein FIBRA_01649 [Fibroporia radiculosa]CCL99629.1 predicted protein [Fibroporia radiculosa]